MGAVAGVSAGVWVALGVGARCAVAGVCGWVGRVGVCAAAPGWPRGVVFR